MPVKVKRRTACRFDGGRLETVADFGQLWVTNFGDKEKVKVPLELTMCQKCHLVQLRHSVDPEALFRRYYYRSGTNETMRMALKDVVDEAMKRRPVQDGDIVVDIGSNDSTLLSNYPEHIVKMGFEPAAELVPRSPGFDAEIIFNFFNAKQYVESWKEGAKIVTACAMFYDLEDPSAFLKDVKKVLAEDGLFVIQQNYLPEMLRQNAADNVVHEHLCYYTLTTLAKVLNANGLIATDVEFNEVNGGSFRVYVRHDKYLQVDPRVTQALKAEEKMGLDKVMTYWDFKRKVVENLFRLKDFVVRESVLHHKRFMVYGASTRGVTTLQLAGLDDPHLIGLAVDRNPDKFDKTMVTGQQIVSEEGMRQSSPDYLLILPWQFLGSFVERERDFLLNGGKFVVPFPEPYLLGAEKI